MFQYFGQILKKKRIFYISKMKIETCFTNILAAIRAVGDSKAWNVFLDLLSYFLWSEAHGIDIVGAEA